MTEERGVRPDEPVAMRRGRLFRALFSVAQQSRRSGTRTSARDLAATPCCWFGGHDALAAQKLADYWLEFLAGAE